MYYGNIMVVLVFFFKNTPQQGCTLINMHQNLTVFLYKRTGLGSRSIGMEIMQALVSRFLAPRLAGNFLAGLQSLSLVRVADLNSVLRANFGAHKNQRRAAFYFSTGCAKCECFAGAISHCNFALCVATKLTWVRACIPPGLQNTSLADCVAWERGGYAENRPVANNAVSSVTIFYLFACFSYPRPVIARLQEFPLPPPYRAQLIPATSTAHPSSQPKPQPLSLSTSLIPTTTTATILPSTAQQENVR